MSVLQVFSSPLPVSTGPGCSWWSSEQPNISPSGQEDDTCPSHVDGQQVSMASCWAVEHGAV